METGIRIDTKSAGQRVGVHVDGVCLDYANGNWSGYYYYFFTFQGVPHSSRMY